MFEIVWQQSQQVTLWQVLVAYFVGHHELLETIVFAANRTVIALQIVLLAGLSDAVGNCVILLANRVRPFRFVLALLANTFIFFFGFLVWALLLSFVANRIFGLTVDPPFFFTVVALSYIPLLLSALNFLPFIGHPINMLLYALSAIYLVRILTAATPLTTLNAFLCAVGGFLLLELFRASVGKPLIHIGQGLVSTAAGRRLEQDIEKALGIQERHRR